jgi:flagellar biosynthesis GTPase FlhF
MIGVKTGKRENIPTARMMPRTYRAKNIPSALAAMEKDLGNGALIVSVHKIPPVKTGKARRQSGVEVVAMPPAVRLPPDGPITASGERGTPFATSFWNEPTPGSMNPPIRKGALPLPLSNKVPPKKPSRKPARSSASESMASLDACLLHLQNRLRTQGLEESWIQHATNLLGKPADLRSMQSEAELYECFAKEMRKNLHTFGENSLFGTRVISLIGMNGSGKTSACAKLAAYAIKNLNRRICWISTDTLRLGAIATAQAFTAPLGIPIHLVFRPDELFALVSTHPEYELILVDTPGCNPYRKEELDRLSAFLSKVPEGKSLLTIPSNCKEADLWNSFNAYSALGIDGLAISKLDETLIYGDVFNFALRTQLPIAFFTYGIHILGNLHLRDASPLVNALLGKKGF